MPFASTPVTASVGVGGNLNLGIDVDGVGNNDLFFFLGNHRTSTNTVFLRSTSGFAAVADGTTSSANALNLAPGFAVGPTPVAGAFADYNPWLLYSSGGSHAFGNFRNGTTGYIGFRFNGDTGSGGTQYGWMKVRIDTGDDFTKLTLLDGAYDDEGDPIVVGATGDGGGEVPVPATSLLTLLGLGALGVQRYRRRRDAGLARLAGEQAAA
jgi:hypothetical protein